MELTLMRVTKIELGNIREDITYSTRTIFITTEDGKDVTVVCFAKNDEFDTPTEALKVAV